MKLYIADHQGMIRSALVPRYACEAEVTLFLRSCHKLDLANQAAVPAFFAMERLGVAIIAAVPRA